MAAWLPPPFIAHHPATPGWSQYILGSMHVRALLHFWQACTCSTGTTIVLRAVAHMCASMLCVPCNTLDCTYGASDACTGNEHTDTRDTVSYIQVYSRHPYADTPCHAGPCATPGTSYCIEYDLVLHNTIPVICSRMKHCSSWTS